ncbi:class I SAM-dependent methyltransferase [Gryllotalpicola ginsengisoli]|uniref:class I SAM-dependent methyltransferase n=1 Tax=Gryllotalpicola ginsengisoli TaxID=444608 RepID=UPI0003B44B39|nr:class I SAM-dependent methyltransferase [Gryllotalpicola ginsengisoli]
MREEQLRYSELPGRIKNEETRRRKAQKILSVVKHALGRDDLDGISALDVGCSTGILADSLADAGAQAHGVDIDEPGVQRAAQRFGHHVDFQVASGDALPYDDESMDLVTFNHIYEHVVSPEAVVAQIRRVLKPSGIAYFGFGQRLVVIEPHYKLPFLSWLPQKAADLYMQATGKGDNYYEQFRFRGELRKLVKDFDVWDYTFPVLVEPEAFANDDLAPGWARHASKEVLTALLPLIPTYIWVGFKTPRQPSGPPLRIPPQPLSRRPVR